MSNTKKVNKILMSIAAILLCLVLISTSVLSGVFAKFVVTKSGSATVGFTKFGVTVKMSVADATDLKNKGASVSSEVFESTGGVITISDLKMTPGDDFTNAVKFEFEGKPVRPVKVVITPTVTFTNASGSTTESAIYTVPANTITGLSTTEATAFMPIGFTFSYNDTAASEANYSCPPWSTNTTPAALEAAIANGIASKITDSSATAPTDGVEISVNATPAVLIQNFATNTALTFTIGGASRTSFHAGFFYPKNHGETPEEIAMYDKISTYIADNQGAETSITVAYAVAVYQY